MILTNENYFSKEASREYLSVSQYKNFMGTMGSTGCESRAIAELDGEWEMNSKTTSLLVGSYVDAHFEGTLDIFKAQNPEIFTQKGTLKAEYKQAEEIINRIERDSLFMQFMSGEKQVIMTSDMYGSPWKIKMDSYIQDKAIVDLKVMKSLRDRFYHKDYGYMDFIQEWGYDIQGAVYQEVVYRNTGKRLPFFIAAASKEKETDIELIWIPDEHLKEKLIEVEQNTSKIMMLKNREVEPVKCGTCDYCKHTKVLTKAIHFSELLGEI
jgi:hypothetical protein